jgi:hypothetical protein
MHSFASTTEARMRHRRWIAEREHLPAILAGQAKNRK